MDRYRIALGKTPSEEDLEEEKKSKEFLSTAISCDFSFGKVDRERYTYSQADVIRTSWLHNMCNIRLR
jgi:hypothetical protein